MQRKHLFLLYFLIISRDTFFFVVVPVKILARQVKKLQTFYYY